MSRVIASIYDFITCLVLDELLLPHMKRVDGMITDNRKRLLHKLHIGQVLKVGAFLNVHVVPWCVRSGKEIVKRIVFECDKSCLR